MNSKLFKRMLLGAACCAALASCGGGGGGGSPAPGPIGSPSPSPAPIGSPAPTPAPPATPPTSQDAARFLTQATFGIQSETQIEALRQKGFDAWLNEQFGLQAASHLAYLKAQETRTDDKHATEEMSYEAMWQQWLTSDAQLRARASWSLLQVFVISNIAPDLEPEGMSSYMDMLNTNAFGNYRKLLEDVTLHPAMGYYLSMLQSKKEDPSTGESPNENYAREVLQLFSIGLVKLNIDGSTQKDAQGRAIPSYGEAEVKGFARAFSGWSYATGNVSSSDSFFDADEDWVRPMKPWASMHSTAEKQLLDGVKIPAGGSPEADMRAALDNIFNHPNVGPFMAKRLIQRMVTSNPSPEYIARVATVFNRNEQGVRGDLKAVFRAILLDTEARNTSMLQSASYGKQREPVIRFANLLRATGAKSKSGTNRIHYLDFYTPFYAPPGPVAQAGLVAPEFQITSEISVVGSLNFFARLVNEGKYHSWENDDHSMEMNLNAFTSAASDTDALIARINAMLLNYALSDASRTSLRKAIAAIPAQTAADREKRVKAALLLTTVSPDFAIQR
jgi:uncharacterized protein (DUF1800 family)